MRTLSRRSASRRCSASAFVFHLADHMVAIAHPRRRDYRSVQSDRLYAVDYARPADGESDRPHELVWFGRPRRFVYRSDDLHLYELPRARGLLGVMVTNLSVWKLHASDRSPQY